MTMRRMVLLLHRWVGLGLALFLLVAGATGCVLVFRPELDALLNPQLFQAPPGSVLPGPELAQRLTASHPDWVVQSCPVHAASGRAFRVEVRPVDVDVGGQVVRQAGEVFLDPRDGAVTGARSRGPWPDRAHLFAAILSLHYALLAGTPGEWLMGSAAALWLGLNLLGLVITWPRRPPRLRNWAPSWVTGRRGLRVRPLIELHRVAGLWLVLLLTVLAYTSVALNFYDALFAPAVEAVSPPRVRLSPVVSSRVANTDGIGFARALAAAEHASAERTPELSPATMSEDRTLDLYGIGFSPHGTLLYENAGPVTYFIGRHDGRLVWIDQPRLDGWGRVLERTLYPLHSGQVLGLASRLVVLALGLVTVGLTLTGFLPWWKRWRLRRRTRAAPAEAAPAGAARARAGP